MVKSAPHNVGKNAELRAVLQDLRALTARVEALIDYGPSAPRWLSSADVVGLVPGISTTQSARNLIRKFRLGIKRNGHWIADRLLLEALIRER
jgi:hypothetical protein